MSITAAVRAQFPHRDADRAGSEGGDDFFLTVVAGKRHTVGIPESEGGVQR